VTLLRDIQHDAAYGEGKVSALLRKCKILASRIHSDDFSRWIDHELVGYPEQEVLPEYRVLRGVESHGHFAGVAGSAIRNARIPSGSLPEPLRQRITELHLREGIAQFEELLKGDQDPLHVDWPSDLIARVALEIYDGYGCMAAWRIVPRATIAGLVDSVRNRILAFALELERLNPDAGEAQASDTPIAPNAVHQVFQTNIYGTVGNFAAGSTNVTQQSEITISGGDLDGLKRELCRLGIHQEDVAALEAALRDDQAAQEPGFGTRAKAWLGNMMAKAATGAWTVSMQTAGAVLPKLLAEYLNLRP
jgi:hypothetical protein